MRVPRLPAPNAVLLGYDVPADGTSAATGESEDFGTSPFYGQHLNKLPLAYNPTMGASEAKHKKLVC